MTLTRRGLLLGGLGALVYARAKPVRRMALLSPALFQDWSDAQTVHAFAGERQWADYEPSFPHGQHDDDFWRRMLPLAIPYVAD